MKLSLEFEDVERMREILPTFQRDNGPSDLSENETQDNVSMNNYKNTLAALSARTERGEIHHGTA